MIKYLILFAVIIFICVFLNNFSKKFGIPVLLLFIILGILYGWNTNDFTAQEYGFVESLCSIALIFIMFYGGFGTRWSSAKPVIIESGTLATLGVFMTAALVGIFCHFALHWSWVEGLLMGSVISSTDAASVFSILRTRKLGLKDNTAPLLEIESGSNDPCSYMLTVIMLSILNGTAGGGRIVWDIFAQFFFGALFGLAIAWLAGYLLRTFKFPDGFDSMFILAVALISYALPNVVGGNGYLSAYIVGISLGNKEFHGKKSLVGFFDGVTSFMQILIFFLLGLISIPSHLASAIIPATLIFLFLTIIARPLAVCSILAPFRKYKLRHMGLVSFVGLRGASSIVFAIMTITKGASLEHDIFSIVFCIVLVSIALQGSLIPAAARGMKMIDANEDILRTFSDFAENSQMNFSTLKITENDFLAGKEIKDVPLPKEIIIALILRGNENIIPKGNTVLLAGDRLVLCAKEFKNDSLVQLVEHRISKDSRWNGQLIKDYPHQANALIVMVRRGEEEIIPNGNTMLLSGDTLVILKR